MAKKSKTPETTSNDNIFSAESGSGGDDERDPSDTDSGESESLETAGISLAPEDAEDAILLSEDSDIAAGEESQAEDILTQPEIAPASSPAPNNRGGSFFGLVLGGLIAGAIGFLVALLGFPDGWPNSQGTNSAELAESLEVQASALAKLESQVSSLASGVSEVGAKVSGLPDASQIPSLDAVETDIKDLSQRLEQLASEVEGIAARVGDIAARPLELSPDGQAEMSAQLQAFQNELDKVTANARAEIEAAQDHASQIEAEALAAAEASKKTAALSEISVALESGVSFEGSLEAFDDVPIGLLAVSADGVPTLPDLQGDFPGLARAALGSVQTVAEDASTGDRLAAFLRRHTNARSLAPRDGDDPDAILSRAEAALLEGDLSLVLAELKVLPEPAVSKFSDWTKRVKSRSDAIAALNELTQSVN